MNVEQIKGMTRHDWTDELIHEAIESLKEINPTLEVIQTVINCDRPEVVVPHVKHKTKINPAEKGGSP